MKILLPVFAAIAAALLPACIERTVTDSSGRVIYQDIEPHRLHESDEKKREEVMETERELGR